MKIMAGIALSLPLHFGIYEYASMKKQLEFSTLQVEVLRDQVNDSFSQISALRVRTYEDGVRDGIENSKDQLYMRAYHMASQHAKGLLPSEEAHATAGSP